MPSTIRRTLRHSAGGRHLKRAGGATPGRYRTEYYWQTETVEVNNDQCGRRFAVSPAKGHVYLVQFNYIGGNECTARCFEQLPSPTGEFQLAPCPAGPAPG